MQKQLELSLKFIENEENYYAGFWAVIEHCILAMYLKNILWDNGVIGDNELHYYTQKIQLARQKAIEKHRDFTIRILKENERKHSIETVVNSVYADVFHL